MRVYFSSDPEWDRRDGISAMELTPAFNLDGYRQMLEALQEHYTFEPLRTIAVPNEHACYLRHDIDIHLDIEAIAEIDAMLGITSTFFVLLSGDYNVCRPDSIAVLKHLAGLGHDIGLHYDLRAYPSEQLAYLAFEASILERLSGCPVSCITMHEPSAQEDTLRNIACYIHPHAFDVPYISDSCKRWRDDRIVAAMMGHGPSRLHLNIHPELWLDDRDWDELKKGVSHGHGHGGGGVPIQPRADESY